MTVFPAPFAFYIENLVLLVANLFIFILIPPLYDLFVTHKDLCGNLLKKIDIFARLGVSRLLKTRPKLTKSACL